jgi:hypothetical protein
MEGKKLKTMELEDVMDDIFIKDIPNSENCYLKDRLSAHSTFLDRVPHILEDGIRPMPEKAVDHFLEDAEGNVKYHYEKLYGRSPEREGSIYVWGDLKGAMGYHSFMGKKEGVDIEMPAMVLGYAQPTDICGVDIEFGYTDVPLYPDYDWGNFLMKFAQKGYSLPLQMGGSGIEGHMNPHSVVGYCNMKRPFLDAFADKYELQGNNFSDIYRELAENDIQKGIKDLDNSLTEPSNWICEIYEDKIE